MAFNSNITVGAPPLLWSDVQEAFRKVNENFDEIVAATGLGINPVNFETLDTNVSPTTDNTYKLGDITHKWKSVHTSEFTLTDSTNGLWLGNAHIKGLGFTVNLPDNSTIGGDPLTGIGTSLIIDPEKTFFKTIEVDNNLSVVATTFGDTLNLLSGSGISLTVNSSGDSIEIDNTGILSVLSGNGISVSTVSGNTTVTNAGVRSLQNVTALPAGRSTGAGINISGSVGDNLRITNTGILTVSGGIGITVSTDIASGEVQITNAAPAGNAFAVVQINGDVVNRIIADGVADTFNINSGQGIILTKNTVTDTMTITVDPVFDLRGSVFGDNSSKIVDAVENKVYAEFFGNITGNVTGNVTGAVTGNADSATVASAVTLVATNSTNAAHFITFVDTATGNENVRTDTSLTYNPNSNTLTAGTFSGNVSGTVTGNIFTNLIDSADSSQIVVTPIMKFESDVIVENDLTVAERLILKGSRVINSNELKSIVALSANFADFQARIAALV